MDSILYAYVLNIVYKKSLLTAVFDYLCIIVP